MRQINRRTCRALALAPLAALSLCAACRPRGEEPQPSVAPSQAPQRGGTLVVGTLSDPVGINEYVLPSSRTTSDVVWRLFLHLMEEQPDFTEHPPTFEPQLARSWDWSADRTALTFKLHPDAVWSDGVPVTAADVRWTWQVQTDPAVGWTDVEIKKHITDVEVVNAKTVRFHFSRAYPSQLLDVNEGVIIPKHVWSQLPISDWRSNVDWFRKNLVVSGPFTVGSWEPQQQVVLVRNERYHDADLPYLDRLVLRVIPDTSSLVTQLESGAIDFVAQINRTDVPRLQANPKLDVLAYWINLYVAVGWNTEKPQFADPEVRRALALAIDRQSIVDTVWGDYGRVGVTPVLTAVWAHDKSLQALPFDPAEARKILAAKGWKDTNGDGVLDLGGKPFAFEILTNAGNVQRNDAAVMMQDHLGKIGVRAQVKVVDFNTLITQTLAGRFDATILGFNMDTSLDLSSNFHSRAVDVDNNFSRYKNPELDALLDRFDQQTDYQAIVPILHQIERIVHREQPVTLLWESQRMTGINRRVRNAQPNMIEPLANVEEWWVAPDA